jgi:hypothetical protein
LRASPCIRGEYCYCKGKKAANKREWTQMKNRPTKNAPPNISVFHLRAFPCIRGEYIAAAKEKMPQINVNGRK